MPRTLPYGSWRSPVSTDLITGSTVGLIGGTFDGGTAFWVESHASQGGRASLWTQAADSTRTELTPEHNVRSAVHEYGGGAFAVSDEICVFSDHPSHGVFVVEGGARPRPIAAGGLMRYGGFVVRPRQRSVVCVREDHTDSDLDCVNTLVSLSLDTDNADGGRIVAAGADFFSQPAIAPDGRLAWFEWDHPSMPWDSTRLMIAAADGTSARQVAGGPQESAIHPAWTESGDLIFASDRSGFWNLYRVAANLDPSDPISEPRRLHDDPYDCCETPWVLGGAPYVLLDDDRIAVNLIVEGQARVGIVADGAFTPLALDVAAASFGGSGPASVAVLGYGDRPSELVVVNWEEGSTSLLRRSSDVDLETAFVSRAHPVVWESQDGPVQARWYPPTNPDVEPPPAELPPIIVVSHGGPTGRARAEFNLAYQFWTSRGIGIVDVDYSGSSGYGRAYRQRLHRRWGLSDVRDCAAAAENLVAEGWADPDRLTIMGGSAGGFTTLAALTTTDVFRAGISNYGVGDLETLATDTHKFESRYLDGLVAPYPAERQVYLDRSPVYHVDQLSCPLLLHQGTDDRVVPPDQAEQMAAAVRAKGLPVALCLYEGEGHGFRRAETIRDQLNATLSFLGQVYGFEPSGEVPRLDIENLSRAD